MQNQRYRTLIVFFFYLFFPLIVIADSDSVEKDVNEIVITATRGDMPAYEAPYTINVINEDELKQKQFRSLPEALSETPGVLVQKTANGHGSAFIRGFTGYRTLSLIDGVRYNNSVYRDGPNEYFSLIDFNTLESIELLSGSTSTLYGSDAIGGTLNLRTKSSNYIYEPEGYLFIHGSQSNRLSTAESSHISRTEFEFGEGQSWGLHLGYSFKGFGDINVAEIGKLPETGYEEYSYDARFDIALSNKWDLTLVHQNLSQDDVWRTHSTILSKSFSGTTVGTDLHRLKDQERSLNYIKLTGFDLNIYIDKADLTLSYQLWDEDGDRLRANDTRIIDYFNSRMFGIDLQFESFTSLGGFVYGFDYYQDNVDSGRTDFNADGTIDRIRIQGPIGDDSSYRLFGAYVQGEFSLTERMTLTVGSRFTYTHADVGRFEDPNTGFAAAFEDSWTSSVNSIRANYSLNEENTWKAWVGISQSFRAPNIGDLSRFGVSRTDETEVAATNLDPEEFLTYEVGIKTNNKKLNMTGTYYFTDISDFITSTPTGKAVSGLTEVSKQNSADGFVQGIELTADYALENGFKPYANMTWLEGELDAFNTTSSNVIATEALSRIMPLTSTIGVKWDSVDKSLWFNLSLTHATKANKLSSGDISDTERIPPGGTPAYTLINIRSGKTIHKYFDINIALTNLLDEAYRSHGSGTNEPGFGLTVGLTARF